MGVQHTHTHLKQKKGKHERTNEHMSHVLAYCKLALWNWQHFQMTNVLRFIDWLISTDSKQTHTQTHTHTTGKSKSAGCFSRPPKLCGCFDLWLTALKSLPDCHKLTPFISMYQQYSILRGILQSSLTPQFGIKSLALCGWFVTLRCHFLRPLWDSSRPKETKQPPGDPAMPESRVAREGRAVAIPRNALIDQA